MASAQRLSPYATPSATRAVLERHGLYTKYGLGQNFLVNDDIVRKITELAELGPADYVLEVGPGIGTLTAALLQRAGRVTAVEMDHDLPAVLADTLAAWADRFSLIEKDGLDVTEADLDEVASRVDGSGADSVAALPNKMVSNLPYAVAATIVLDYLQRFDFIESATVMVQKEVADRMCAKPGSKTYGAYTVKLGLFAEPAGRFPVAPGNFFPPPHVESAVLRLDRARPVDEAGVPLSDDVRRAACAMADAAFATRRKTLGNSCKTYFSGQGDPGKAIAAQLPQLFEQAQIDPQRRGETLSQQDFIRLAQSFVKLTATA